MTSSVWGAVLGAKSNVGKEYRFFHALALESTACDLSFRQQQVVGEEHVLRGGLSRFLGSVDLAGRPDQHVEVPDAGDPDLGRCVTSIQTLRLS